MLDIRRVLASAPKKHTEETLNALTTVWGEALNPSEVLSEHPRPRMKRDNIVVLNGVWNYVMVPFNGAPDVERLAQETIPSHWDGEIVVPFSPEAPLSGVGRTLHPDELLWYKRVVEFPKLSPEQRLILHFEAVDWRCACFVNERLAGTHTGGYLPFSYDITDLLDTRERAEIAVCVYDPSDTGTQLRGKQMLSRGDIWYTAQSGIWQSVWCETVPAAHLEELTLQGDMNGYIDLHARSSVHLENSALSDSRLFDNATLELTLFDADGRNVLETTLPIEKNGEICARLHIDEPRLWSHEAPYIYEALVALHVGSAVDIVRSYCAFRTVKVEADANGVSRIHLNGKPFFVKGVLDQGYWPDGLMTAPSDAALLYDIQAMRAAGFNTLRKHIKIECERWYYHCDRLGMLVWQDCVSGGNSYSSWHTSQKPTLFSFTWARFQDRTKRHQEALSAADANYQQEWTATCHAMVRLLDGHPSVAVWTLFNEGWGQFDAKTAVESVRALDATRPIDAVSGWYDQGCGDVLSIHNYFRPLGAGWRGRHTSNAGHGQKPGDGRAVVISEFGGLAQMVAGHASLNHAYGYGNFATADEWKAAVQQELAKAESLQGEGLAGYIYTQLSDVEEEVNGLLTYDRKINKLSC